MDGGTCYGTARCRSAGLGRVLAVCYGMIGLGSLATALWMIARPAAWYTSFPGVTQTGPFNVHFVRDIGVTLAIMALLLLWSATRPGRSRGTHVLVTAYFLGHAAVHIAGWLNGTLPAAHWYQDIVGVLLPAVLLGVFALPPVWRRVQSLPLLV